MQTRQNKEIALLVDPKEAARLLGISPRKLWAMTFQETPALPYVKLGRLTRYRPSDLERYLDQQQTKGGPA